MCLGSSVSFFLCLCSCPFSFLCCLYCSLCLYFFLPWFFACPFFYVLLFSCHLVASCYCFIYFFCFPFFLYFFLSLALSFFLCFFPLFGLISFHLSGLSFSASLSFCLSCFSLFFSFLLFVLGPFHVVFMYHSHVPKSLPAAKWCDFDFARWPSENTVKTGAWRSWKHKQKTHIFGATVLVGEPVRQAR